MDFPTDIKDAADYLDNFVKDAETTRDLAASRRRIENLRLPLLELGRNDYQKQLVLGATSAIANYLKPRRVGVPEQRQLVLGALIRLRNAPTFGPKTQE